MDIVSIYGKTLFSADAQTIKGLVEKAVAAGANLSRANLADADLARANLSGANLAGANLARANLSGANLADANLADANLAGADLADARLATGETWSEYTEQVVPALLTAGGKTLDAVLATGCWECHQWENCPMHEAFGIKTAEEAPPLWRNRVKQFVQLFDAKLIPKPEIRKDIPV